MFKEKAEVEAPTYSCQKPFASKANKLYQRIKEEIRTWIYGYHNPGTYMLKSPVSSAGVKMTIEKFMENLRSEMWKEIESKNYGMMEFAVRCNMSYENLRKILNGQRKDISVSLLLGILESGIDFNNVFKKKNVRKKEHVVIKIGSVELSGTMEVR